MVAGALTSLGECLQALRLGVPGKATGSTSPGRCSRAALATVFAILASFVIRLAVSRQSVFRADEGGALLLGDPCRLVRALDKIESYALGTRLAVTPAASHLFVVTPFTGAPAEHLFDVGPSMRRRTERLELLIRRVAPGRPRYRHAWAG